MFKHNKEFTSMNLVVCLNIDYAYQGASLLNTLIANNI